MATENKVHSHSYRHFDNLQLSAKGFYDELVEQIRSYEFPYTETDIRLKRENGYFSAEREYLCVFRADMEFAICAAPFGKSFFISWYLVENRSSMSEFLSRLWIIGWLFRPARKTFYQIDSELMFCKSIDAIVRSVVARVGADHGFTMTNEQLITA